MVKLRRGIHKQGKARQGKARGAHAKRRKRKETSRVVERWQKTRVLQSKMRKAKTVTQEIPPQYCREQKVVKHQKPPTQARKHKQENTNARPPVR